MPRKKIEKNSTGQKEPKLTSTASLSEQPTTIPETKVEAKPVRDDYSAIECDGVRVRHHNPGGDASRMFDYLASCPKVPLFIPLGWGEKEGAEQWAQMNDLAIIIQKNKMVMVPKPLSDHLMESLSFTANALAPFTVAKDGKVIRSTESKHPFAHHGE